MGGIETCARYGYYVSVCVHYTLGHNTNGREFPYPKHHETMLGTQSLLQDRRPKGEEREDWGMGAPIWRGNSFS